MSGLSRVFVIANSFDNLVSIGSGDGSVRLQRALMMMDGPLSSKFDPKLLPKALRLLSENSETGKL